MTKTERNYLRAHRATLPAIERIAFDNRFVEGLPLGLFLMATEADDLAGAMPPGFRRGHDDSIACPHRDLSCCDACVAAHVELVDVAGRHFWYATEAERTAMAAEIARVSAKRATRKSERSS